MTQELEEFAKLTQQLMLASAALAALVRGEYGDKYTLATIANTWGEGITAEQISALDALENGSLAKALDKLTNDLGW